jgi:hypothetical protein
VVTIKIAARGLPVQTITLIEVGSAIVLLGAVVLHRQTRLTRPSRLVVFAGLLEPGASYPLINAGLAGPAGRTGRSSSAPSRSSLCCSAPGGAVLAAAVLGSAVAFSLYNWALTQVRTVAAGISLTLIPVFGVAFSAALLNEPVTLATLAAAVAVVVGVVASVEPEPKPPAPAETVTTVDCLSHDLTGPARILMTAESRDSCSVSRSHPASIVSRCRGSLSHR